MTYLHMFFPVVAVMMATTVIVYRIRETKKPSTVKKILIPPLAMSTGFLMFLYPPTHIPWSWACIAFLSGALFLSPPLIYSSRFHIVQKHIYLKQSRFFIVILFVLFSLRLALHQYIETFISIFQTGAIFFILAFGMLLPWRVTLYLRFKKMMETAFLQESS